MVPLITHFFYNQSIRSPFSFLTISSANTITHPSSLHHLHRSHDLRSGCSELILLKHILKNNLTKKAKFMNLFYITKITFTVHTNTDPTT